MIGNKVMERFNNENKTLRNSPLTMELYQESNEGNDDIAQTNTNDQPEEETKEGSFWKI